MSGEVIAAWAGAAVALLGAGLATWQANRAIHAATRSAAADERAAVAAERANELAEQQVTKYVPEWTISPLGGHGYELTNGTGETAYDVTARPVDRRQYFGDWSDPSEDLGHGESLTFTTQRGIGGGDHRFVVSWSRDPGGEQMTQRKPLPPQPPPRSLNLR